MDKTLSLFFVFILGVFFAYQSLALSTYTNVSVSEAKQMIDTNPDLVKLDVRTEEEYNDGHIANAILIPVNELESRLDELDKEKETLVYCRSGVRSATASQILVDNGFSNVYNMLGGIVAWTNEGYPIYILGDVNIDGIVDIFDVVLAASAFDSRPGDSNWNHAADLNNDDVVDIFDIALLANNFGKTT